MWYNRASEKKSALNRLFLAQNKKPGFPGSFFVPDFVDAVVCGFYGRFARRHTLDQVVVFIHLFFKVIQPGEDNAAQAAETDGINDHLNPKLRLHSAPPYNVPLRLLSRY
jgi:hypothetical protein